MEKLQIKDAKELELSFDFQIKSFENRNFVIAVNGMLRDIQYSPSFNEWFIEDLIYFLEKNRYQLRWDVQIVLLENLESLKLSKEHLQSLKDFLVSNITNFDITFK
ncbi:hypothetical protein [Mycoplasmopsis gallinacea]|uniref:Uncharacterized protein n=1 Tax=Mycoplasmopsis gallinacea TaxID=29556 RepID=A0A0D5ZK62_9BACT|nr:hypothetical protein [Mycoplasmopsis gallinacea]AKA50030.1 hypothetical protein VO56_02080 [Mycoplasmopsis gallinacea]QIW62108.1 hypothetical protein GOQ20_01395 [Mycoplasmopsis gallinacea]